MPDDWTGEVVSLHIAPAASQPMESPREVQAVPGRGLVGDRYYLGTGFYSDRPQPERQITLIELETLDYLRRTLNIALSPAEARRNVVTRGVGLNGLVGSRFRIGEVIVEGIRLCEPCQHLVELTGKPVLEPLVRRGGLNAIIHQPGRIRVGDLLRPV